jgi:hypothetical protein
MTLPPSINAFGWLDAWMANKRNVLRFLLVRFLVMAAMVLAFSVLYRSHS